jgi:hypothetical protein
MFATEVFSQSFTVAMICLMIDLLSKGKSRCVRLSLDRYSVPPISTLFTKLNFCPVDGHIMDLHVTTASNEELTQFCIQRERRCRVCRHFRRNSGQSQPYHRSDMGIQCDCR